MKKALVCLAFLAVALSARANPIGIEVLDPCYLHCLALGYATAVVLEVLATCWVRRKNWVVAVAFVNCITFPLFLLFLEIVPHRYREGSNLFHQCYVPLAEIVIAVIESFLLSLVYRFKDWKCLMGFSFLMNAFSYGVSMFLTFFISGRTS